jgi:hypothetical protein
MAESLYIMARAENNPEKISIKSIWQPENKSTQLWQILPDGKKIPGIFCRNCAWHNV